MNKRNQTNIVVAIARRNNAKIGAIYFDHVVPIFVDDIPNSLFPPGFENWKPSPLITVLRTAQKKYKAKRIVVTLPNGTKISLVDEQGIPDLNALELASELSFLNDMNQQSKLYQQMYKANIEHAPIITSGEIVTANKTTRNLSDVTITIANMPLLSVEGAYWEQILELRKDTEALRRLRLYLSKNYIGLPKEQIEAGIALDIEKYKENASKHGFSLITGIMQATSDARTLLGSIGGGAFLGSLLGPETTTMGALVGISLEIAKVSISVANGLYDLRQLKRNHPLAYVFSAQNALLNDNNK